MIEDFDNGYESEQTIMEGTKKGNDKLIFHTETPLKKTQNTECY